MLIKHYLDTTEDPVWLQYYMPESFTVESIDGSSKRTLTMYFPYGPKKITISPDIKFSTDYNVMCVYSR